MSHESALVSRREALCMTATAGAVGFAGCGGGSNSSQTDSGTQSTESESQPQTGTMSETSETTGDPDSSVDFRWQSLAGDPGSASATSVETQFRGLTLARSWGDAVGGAEEITGFAATPEQFIVSVVRSGSGPVNSHPLPGGKGGSSQEWSASRLSSSILHLANGQLHVLSGNNDTYRQLDINGGDVANEVELSSLLDADVQGIMLVDNQYAYVDISGGIAAVDHTSDSASVVWTNSDLRHGTSRAIRTGDHVLVSQGNNNGTPGMTTLSIDSGQSVAAISPQMGDGPDLGNISTGVAGTYAYRFNTEQNNKSLVRVDPETLSVVWEAEDVVIGGAQRPKIAVGNDIVLTSPTQDGLVAVEASDGSTRWSVRGRFLTPGVSANAAYGYASGSLFGIDLENGEVATETDSAIDGIQILAVVPIPDGALVVTNETVNLFT